MADSNDLGGFVTKAGLNAMKILFQTAHSLRVYGGAEKWLITVANSLKGKGDDVEIISLSYLLQGIERVDLESVKSKLSVPYVEIPFKKGKITPLQMADNSIDYSRFDVVYTTAPYYMFLKQLLGKSKTKNIYGLHDPALQKKDLGNLQRRVVNNLIPKFSIIHLQDLSQKEIFANVDDRYKVLPIWHVGSYPVIEEKKQSDRFTVLFIGRHDTSKGFDTLLKVAGELPDDLDLIIFGVGPRSNELESINRANVKIKGFVSDAELDEAMEKSHALLYPSSSESTTSMTLNDAIAYGLPVVYRPIPQNAQLSSYGDFKEAEDDSQFLESLISLHNEWKADPSAYFTKRKRIQEYLKDKGDYVDEFKREILEG